MSGVRLSAERTARLAVRPLGSPVVWAVKQRARQEAAELLAEARQEAERVLAAARAEAAGLRRSAEQEGMQRARRRLADQVAAVLAWRKRHGEALFDAQVELAGRMARRILLAELSQRPRALRRICRAVLREVEPGEAVRLQLHPADRQADPELGPALEAELGGPVAVESSPTVGRGGCRVVGPAGVIDARIEVQLDQLRRAVLERDDAPSG
jgi:flagellar biosynthesis/type III secretory pathway protein FliH